MKRTFTSLVAAAAVSLTASAFAQSATTTAKASDKDDMTITGCVEKNKSGGYWLMESRESASAGAASTTTAPKGTSGSASTTSGAATTTAGDKAARSASSHHYWNLDNAHDIDKYVNQQVRVTGRAKNSTSGDEVKGTTGPETQARDFHVKSVQPTGGSCK
jgi:hypothetical protein